MDRTKITINLKALSSNLKYASALAPGKKIMSVIKADGYGHGAIRVARTLTASNSFAVARLEEAEDLRMAGLNSPVCVLEGVSSEQDFLRAKELGLQLILHSWYQVTLYKKYGPGVPIWLKIDSGMGRLGFAIHQCLEVLKSVNGLNLIGIVSHLSHADDVSSNRTVEQLQILSKEILPIVKKQKLEFNLSNSAGLLGWKESLSDWIRPGLMLFGVSPFSDFKSREDLLPCMTFSAPIIAVKEIKRGQSVGYGGIFTAAENTRIAIVAAGYADGYPREIEQGAPVLIDGKRFPLVGRVSMDLICVEIKNSRIETGDIAILWGESLRVEEIARLAKTIPYTLLTGISRRVGREFLEEV
ncbi:MAG: alanine racemase [Pseudomonadota bacterium]|nr:alanine racemase [Pseudomonadota bacterium]